MSEHDSSKTSSPSGTTPDGRTPPLPPPRVPDHELIRRIGRGAYGEVWLARSVTGAFRAVKIVHRQSFDHDRPFEREFEGIQKFEPISRGHDSQVDILHVGRCEDCFYYVMELADDQATGGQIHPDHYTPRTLKSDLLFHGRLPFEECVRIGLALATALENLHGHGLVHRDVKPSNIIFVNGVPKLADIGLVTGVDATRSYVGTEGFAAPEGPGSPQADLYSLGKVLYEMATGKDRQEFPDLPTQLREMPDREGLVELNGVIAGACRHDPKDRYASATAMRADLELLQSGKSLARVHRLEERLRWVSRVGVIVLAVALLILAGWLWQARQMRIVRQLADDKTKLAEEKGRLAEQNRYRLVRLNLANGIREMDQGDLASSLVWLTEALTLATNNPADAAIQRIRIHQLLAQHPRLLNLFPHPANVQAAEFSPDERRVVTACLDGRIRIWDTAHDEKPVAEFQQDGPVGQVRFTRDGQRLYAVQLSQRKQPEHVALLDAATGIPVFPPITDVTAVMLSPDNRWIAVARTNFVVEVIATDTGQVVAKATGHEDRVESVSFSPDSSQFITAGRDRTVRRWNVFTGKPIGSSLRHDQPVLRAVFSRDASRIASTTSTEDSGGPIQFQTWDAATGAALAKPILGQGVNSIFSLDRSGRRLLTGDREAMARVWDADSHVPILPPLKMDSGGRSFDFSPDGDQVAIGSEAGTVRIWDLETGSPVFPPFHNSGRTESVRFNGDGSRLLTANDDGTVKLWDLALVPVDRSLQFLSHERPGVAVSPDGRQLLLAVYEAPARLQLVDLETLKPADNPIPAATTFARVGTVAFDRSGHQWVSASGPTWQSWPNRDTHTLADTAGLWRREEGQIRYFALPHEGRVRGAFFHEDGSQLLTVSDDQMIRIWNTVDGSLRQAIRRPEQDAAWITVSPDLRTAIAIIGGEKGWHMLFRDVQTGRTLGRSPERNVDINAATFSPDGTRVATVGGNQRGRIWDARTGEPLTPYFKHGGILLSIEWSPDGRRVLTAGLSPEVKVWDAATGEMALPPLVMKAKPVERAQFSADGRFIVARSDESLVRVWDAVTSEAVTPLLPHDDMVAAAFVTAAQHLVTVQNDGTVRVWNLTEAALSTKNLSDYARLLAGGATGLADPRRPASAEELAARLRSLRSQQPDLFAISPDRLREWHRREAEDPNTLARAEAAIFHLERLAQLAPEDATIPEQLNRRRALLIPARDSGTPPQLLDLSRAYTHSLDLLPRRDFAELPQGRHKLGGTEFDLRGMVQLDHHSERADHVGPFHPQAIIPVGQRCRTLHFLQATEGEPRVDGSTVARWIVHYADGSAREWTVIYGEQVRDWWWLTKEEPLEAKQATVAWRGRAPVMNLPVTDGVRLFKASWTNPQPDVEITQLEFRIGETALKPFVVAITTE